MNGMEKLTISQQADDFSGDVAFWGLLILILLQKPRLEFLG